MAEAAPWTAAAGVAAPEQASCAQEEWGRGGKQEKYVGGGGGRSSMAGGGRHQLASSGGWRRELNLVWYHVRIRVSLLEPTLTSEAI
jgi:hypothetical protein